MNSAEPSEDVDRVVTLLRRALPVTTDRCVLREVRADDTEAIYAYRSMPEVTRYLGHAPLDRHRTGKLVAQWLGEHTAVTVVCVQGGRAVGDVRIRFRRSSAMQPATTSEVEAGIGYAFHPSVHGRGLATASVGAVLERIPRSRRRPPGDSAGLRSRNSLGARAHSARLHPGRGRPGGGARPRRADLVG